MKLIYRLYYFVIHIFTARHTKGFGVHSPFLFDFTRYVILEKNTFYKFESIEKYRLKLRRNNNVIDIQDFGTGQFSKRKISDIARKSLIQPKYGRLLFRTINYLKLNNLLELGTSLGISTAYIATTSSKNKCISLEGCNNTSHIAENTFKQLNINNIEIINGNINSTLAAALNKLSKVDFVYMDANHSQEATLNYFETIIPYLSENAVIIIDDIHWSKDMKCAWDKIIDNKIVKSSIDLFQVGIIFTNKDLHKKHYKMNF